MNNFLFEKSDWAIDVAENIWSDIFGMPLYCVYRNYNNPELNLVGWLPYSQGKSFNNCVDELVRLKVISAVESLEVKLILESRNSIMATNWTFDEVEKWLDEDETDKEPEEPTEDELEDVEDDALSLSDIDLFTYECKTCGHKNDMLKSGHEGSLVCEHCGSVSL